MPMDYVCEDLASDHPSPSLSSASSFSSSPSSYPQMAAFCEEGMEPKFSRHESPTVPNLLFSDAQPLLLLGEESLDEQKDQALRNTPTLASPSTYPRAPGKERLSAGSPGRSQRGQEGACQVCGERASGNFFGALVCLPCKSFFIRCTKDGEPLFLSQCQGRCNVSKQARNRCQQCRYLKCQAAGMSRKEKPEAIEPGEGQILCRVCGDIANGIHFGVYTCEGCKKFFRRGLLEEQSYVCKGRATCTLNPRNRNNCRYCRYQKCLHVGMSRRAIKMGRPKKLNKDLESVLFSVSRQPELNSSSADTSRHSVDAMTCRMDQPLSSSLGRADHDDDVHSGFVSVSSDSNSSKTIENCELLQPWTQNNHSGGMLPLKKGILRSMLSKEQQAMLRAKWNLERTNENGTMDDRMYIQRDGKSEEPYDQNCSPCPSVGNSDGDLPHLATNDANNVSFVCPVVSPIEIDRRRHRRRRCKSDSPPLLNNGPDEQPCFKRWKSDADSPFSLFKYSASEFSDSTTQSNFETVYHPPFPNLRASTFQDKPHRPEDALDLSSLTSFEDRWNENSCRNPVTCFPVEHHTHHKFSFRQVNRHNKILSSSRQNSPATPRARPQEPETLPRNNKTMSVEKHIGTIGGYSAQTRPPYQNIMDTEHIPPQTQCATPSPNKDLVQANATPISVPRDDSRPCHDDYTPKETMDGFLISKKHLEEIDHFFLLSMSLFINIQKRLKVSSNDTVSSIQALTPRDKTSPRQQTSGSELSSTSRGQPCSPKEQTEDTEPTRQSSASKVDSCHASHPSSPSSSSSSSPRGQTSDNEESTSPTDQSSSQISGDNDQRSSPKRNPLEDDSNRLMPPNGMGSRCLRQSGEFKIATRLDTEYRFPALRVCEYWNHVTSSKQRGHMTREEHRVLQDMLEAYMEMLKNLDESHIASDKNCTNLQDWPKEESSTLMEHVVRRIVRQVKEEIAFMVKVPGFNDFHPDDRIFIIQNICFANVTLMATRDWYDPGTRTFRNMLNWKLPEFHPMYSFRLNAMDLGDQITLLKMDRTEAAMLSALNVTAADISGLNEPAIIEKSRDFLMSALAAHLSYKGLNPETRMKELFNLMPIFRLCGFWTKSLREQIALNRQPNV